MPGSEDVEEHQKSGSVVRMVVSSLVIMLPELTTGFTMAYSSNGLYKFMAPNGAGFVLDIDQISWISIKLENYKYLLP